MSVAVTKGDTSPEGFPLFYNGAGLGSGVLLKVFGERAEQYECYELTQEYSPQTLVVGLHQE